MSIAVVCSHCSAKLNAPDSAAGKKVKCPKCQSVIAVPEALAPEFEVVEDEPQAPKKPKAVVKAAVELDDDEPPRKKRRARDEDDDDQDDDDRPRKKKKKPAEGNSMMVRNIVGGVALIALLVVAGFVFADRFKKKDESGGGGSGGSDDTTPANPRIAGPAPKLQPFAPAGGGGPGPGAGGGRPNPGGNAGAGKSIGTPGQPVTFIAPKGFKITFPGPYSTENLPQRVKDKIGSPILVHIAVDPSTGQAFIAGSVDISSKTTAADKKSVYENVIKAALEEDGNAPLISRKTVMVDGRAWEEIVGKEGKAGTSINRLLQTDSHIYVIAVASRTGTPPADAVKKFFDSFELMN
jgi:hypothetical protein